MFAGMLGRVKLLAYILFVCFLFTGRVLMFWPNNSTAFGLVQPEPTPILVWQLNKQAKLSPGLVQQ